MSFFWKRTYTQANFCFLKSVAQIFSHSFIEVGGGAAAVVKGDSDWLTCLRARHMSWVNAALPAPCSEVSWLWVYLGNVSVRDSNKKTRVHRNITDRHKNRITDRFTDAVGQDLLCLSILHGLLNGIYELIHHRIHISERWRSVLFTINFRNKITLL